jgi:hypothetical protein
VAVKRLSPLSVRTGAQWHYEMEANLSRQQPCGICDQSRTKNDEQSGAAVLPQKGRPAHRPTDSPPLQP